MDTEIKQTRGPKVAVREFSTVFGNYHAFTAPAVPEGEAEVELEFEVTATQGGVEVACDKASVKVLPRW